MTRRRHKPADPQDIVRRRLERAEVDAEIDRLRSIGAVVKLNPAHRIVSAYRASPFVKLRESNTITLAQALAAEWLCEEWAIWKGLDGRPALLAPMPPENNTCHAEIITDRMLKAGRRVRAVLGLVGPMDRDLLAALIAASVEEDAPIPWRDIVRRVCGITQTIRQSQAVACALENLNRACAHVH
jgi:hypothetical protein